MERNSEQILTEWLVLQAQCGKSAAIDQLLRLWYPKLLRYSAHQLRSPEAAKDVVQETLVIVAKRIGSLRDPVAFPRWVYQILQRRGIDYIRKEDRRRSREQPDSNEAIDQAVGQPLGQLDTSIELRTALSKLTQLSNQIIHLRYLDGLTLKEIAGVCGVPEGTVKSRLHNAKRQLRKLLAE